MRILALAFLAALAWLPAQAQAYDRVVVMRVLDGDTFEARVEVWPDVLVAVSIRLAGVDAPELKGKCPAERMTALRAYEVLSDMLDHLPVTLSGVKHDKFAGRVDAVVTAGGVDVAQALIKSGLAVAYDGKKRKDWCGVE